MKGKPSSHKDPGQAAAVTDNRQLASARIGALALGATALGALAIGSLAIGRVRIRRLEVDELLIRKTHMLEQPEPAAKTKTSKSLLQQVGLQPVRHLFRQRKVDCAATYPLPRLLRR